MGVFGTGVAETGVAATGVSGSGCVTAGYDDLSSPLCGSGTAVLR